MAKELKSKTDKLESLKDAKPNLKSNEKSLNPKKDNNDKNLNSTETSNNENQSVPDGPPQLDSSVVDNDDSYMDGFTDDTSGWMADKLEDGISTVKDKAEDGIKNLGSKKGDFEPKMSDLKSDGEDTSNPSSGNNTQSDLQADGDTSEINGSGNGDDNTAEEASVEGQNSSGNGDAMGIDVGDDDGEEEGDSETTLDKLKGFVKNALFKNRGVKIAVHSFNFLVSSLTGAGVPAAAAVAIVSTMSFVTVAAIGVTGAAIASNDTNIKDEKVVQVEDCGDKAHAADAALAGASANGLTTAEQEENVKKIHSALKEWGLTDIQISGVVGNGEQESGLDPKKFESDHVAGGKYKTEENYEKTRKDGPLIEYIFGSWSTFLSYYGSGLDESGYKSGAPEGKHTLGVGVWQWTGGGAMGLYNFSKEKSLDMWSMDAQLTYMLSSFSNKSSYYHRLETFKGMNSSNPEQAAVDFLNRWEYESGNFTPNDGTHAHAEKRAQYAAKWYVKIKEMQVDKTYAKSILDAVVREASAASDAKVSSTSDAYHDCVNESQGFGGTGWQKKGGKFSGANGGFQGWKYNELPDELKQYAIDPRSLGMKYGSQEGWTVGASVYIGINICNQCTTLSAGLMGVLWEKDGQPLGTKHGMTGAGSQLVGQMVSALGVKQRSTPISGDVFSYGSSEGASDNHTGVVSHVFENDDILIIEQNIRGLSGASRTGNPLTTGVNDFEWSYRYIPKSTWKGYYRFTSPEGAGYKISSKAKSVK